MIKQLVQVDICIIGGGMIGSAAALMFAQAEQSVVVIEPQIPRKFNREQAPDLRVSALNLHTIELLKSIDVWQKILQMRATSYHKLSCWELDSMRTDFDAKELGRDYLGYFVENRILQLALWDEIAKHKGIMLKTGVKASHIDVNSGEIIVDEHNKVQAKIIIGADGISSQVRAAANIGQTAWQYSQRANVFSVNMLECFEAATWQQFTSDGPLAFLPMYDQFASLVCYTNAGDSKYLLDLNAKQQQSELSKRMPSGLGDFTVLSSASFPLARAHANQYHAGRAVLVGDAAHSINPLAGQGVNLGFRDLSVLLEVFKAEGLQNFQQVFVHYEKKRRKHNLLMMSAMDVIYATFSNNLLPLKVARNLAMKVADNAGPIKLQVLKYAMGLNN